MKPNRKDRNLLAVGIRQLINQKIGCAEFEDQMDGLYPSNDPTVNSIYMAMLSFCDDTYCDYLSLSKPQWDYLQRLLLVLASDRQWKRMDHYRKSRVQWLAFISFASFAFAFCVFGWSLSLLFCSLAAGVVSLLLEKLRENLNHPTPNIEIIYPFQSIKSLEAAMLETSFRKQRFAGELYPPTDRHRWCSTALDLTSRIVIGPISLLMQLFPNCYEESHVIPN